MPQNDDSVSVTKMRENLAEIIGEVCFAHKRIKLTSNGKDVGAIIPLEDLELLEALEDKIDIELAQQASKDGQFYSLDQVLEENGLSREELEKSVPKSKKKIMKAAK